MRMADWLTYTDIEQLRQLNRYYGCECDHHSKKDLICSLLRHVSKKSHLQKMTEELTPAGYRFLQLIMLDPSLSYTMEELLAKGRAALQGESGEPRTFVVDFLKRGWLFPGYSHRTQYLYHIPSDTREQMVELLAAPYKQGGLTQSPSFYRDEDGQLVSDLYHFLDFLRREIVFITGDGAIHRNQQKQLFKTFYINEEPLTGKEPRFGFGRRYHLYPDRFSLLYDYAFYKEYLVEGDGVISLSESLSGKITHNDGQEGREMYRFWLRLYRKPIPHLPLIIRWIGLLLHSNCLRLEQVYQVVEPWLAPFYYETKTSLFQRVIQMLVHVGILRMGIEAGETYLSLTQSGVKWLHGISAFQERAIEDSFLSTGEKAGK